MRPCEYTLGSRLIWALDFNVHPMCSILAQRYGDTIEVLDELVLDDANTPLACDRFRNRIRGFPRQNGRLMIDIYGDASGHQRRTCGTSADWTIIDPKCKHLILDFERVCWRQDDLGQPTAEIDKSDRMRTHVSDALGYYLVQAFPPGGKIGERRERLF